MPRSVPAVVTFNAGELSPTLRARADLSRYASGCRTLLNMMVLPEGPVTRRPGTRYVARTKSDGIARLIPFEFSTVQAYMIECGPTYFRFYKDGGVIESSPGVPYEISHPYLAGELADLRWVQSADVLYIASPTRPPAKLSRTGHTSWTYAAISFTATPAEWTGSNYPSVAAFYEERLVWAATPNEPQTVWASKTGDFENLTIGSAADDALKFSILDGQVNAIQWLAPMAALIAGTSSAEFAISGENNSSLTPTSAQAKRQMTSGSASLPALTIGYACLHVGRSGRVLWELAYNFTQNGYIGTEISVLSRHLLRAGVVEVAWQQDPWRAVWCVLTDGTLAAVTYMRDQEVVAWHRHELGGTSVKVLSAAAIQAGTDGQLWLLVERDFGGSTRRFVEYLTPDFAQTPDIGDATDAFFVDCGLTYDGSPASTITGLGHLEGRTVQVLADGATHPDVVVSGGQVTLQRAASVAHIGFGYTSEVEPLDIQGGAADGSSLTRMKRVAWLGLVLHRTVGGQVGWRDPRTLQVADLEALEMRLGTDPMDTALPLFTGTFDVRFPARWDRDASVVVRQDQPLPLTVLGIVPRMVTND